VDGTTAGPGVIVTTTQPSSTPATLTDGRDLSPREQLSRSEGSEYAALVRDCPFGFALFDRELRCRSVNGIFADLAGRSVPALAGATLDDVMPPTPALHGHLNALLTGRESVHDVELVVPATEPPGRRCWHVSYFPVRDGADLVTGIGVCVYDVTPRRETLAELAYRSRHDTVTGLPNREVLLEHLDAAIARAERHGCILALLTLAIDRPEAGAHDTTDAVLRVVGARLTEAQRRNETLARWGRADFTMICEDLPDEGAAFAAAGRLRSIAEQPVEAGGRLVAVTANVGLAFHRPGHRAQDLIRRTRHALREAYRERDRNLPDRPATTADDGTS
jgi:diguanylate cyclase (GGDEF)-like protein